MIRIEHSKNIPEYDEFLKTHYNRMCTILEDKDKKYPNEVKTILLDLFKNEKSYLDWMYTPAGELNKRIEDVTKACMNVSLNYAEKWKELLKEVFINKGYGDKDFPKAALIADTGVTTCAYCNRNFVKCIEFDDENGVHFVKGQLDHFYSKSDYPYLAMCLYNLVPCCADCNGVNGKGVTDGEKLINPYTIEDDDDIKFRVEINDKSFLSLKDFRQGAELTVDYNNIKIKRQWENNIETFHIKKIYNSHMDYISNLYYWRYRNNKAYLEFRAKLLQDTTITDSNKDLIALGIYTDEKDYGKRPLSKFCADIARQFGLI